MLEDKNGKQVRTSKGGPLKNKQILRDENDKNEHTSTVEQLEKKEMFRDKKGKWVRTYYDVVSTGKISNERKR